MIKLIKSTFYKEKETKEKLAEFILNSTSLSMGEECKKFENKFAIKQGRKHAIFVSSGSMANLVLLQSLLNLGLLKKGDKIGASALTWSTNIMPIIQLGLVPVIFDCELNNLNVSKNILEKDFDSEIKAIFLTNALGFTADIEAIVDFCEEKNIILLEDNCESLGSKINGKLLGNFGLASTFSTFVGHHLSTIEGGLICTDNEELYEMILMVRAHGWDRNLPQASQSRWREKYGINDFYARYTFYALAYNARPTEIQGFLGNIQLEYWDEIVAKRAENFKKINAIAKQNPDIIPLNLEHLEIISNFAVPVIFKSADLNKAYNKKFNEAGVETRPIIAGNIVDQPFFKNYYKNIFSCPNASLIKENGFYFGNNPEMTEDDTELPCSLLKK
ncbi:MAG: DegT/DnrJ/EryC1/StrS aminotransferase family protein [Parcubacteria group bacterium]